MPNGKQPAMIEDCGADDVCGQAATFDDTFVEISVHNTYLVTFNKNLVPGPELLLEGGKTGVSSEMVETSHKNKRYMGCFEHMAHSVLVPWSVRKGATACRSPS